MNRRRPSLGKSRVRQVLGTSERDLLAFGGKAWRKPFIQLISKVNLFQTVATFCCVLNVFFMNRPIPHAIDLA